MKKQRDKNEPKPPTAEQLARMGPQLEDSFIEDEQDLIRLLRGDVIRAVEELIEKKADGLPEMRYLVRLYYQHQKFRMHSGNVIKRYTERGKSHTLVSWAFHRDLGMEKNLVSALTYYANKESTGMGAWCAPEGSQVTTVQGQRKSIEELHDGDRVVSFDRHHAHLTRPQEVKTAWRPYFGELVGVRTADQFTETTPNHRWVTRLARRADCFSVYLMRNGDRFRVGRCALFTRSGKDFMRLGIQARARHQHAEVWILKVCSTESEAAVYEQYVATSYGLTEMSFLWDDIGRRPPRTSDRRTTGLRGQEEIDQFFTMLNAQEQEARAAACLSDHGRDIELPLWKWTCKMGVKSRHHCLETAACNLLPEIMEVAAPSPTTYFGTHWLPLVDAPRRIYEGMVHSLNVDKFHTYIQDGLITCNSQQAVGIGPVISVGLLANIDQRRRKVSQLWSFAGLNPDMPKKWGSLGKRPYNAQLKLLAFKIGHSFMMMHNKPGCFYGRVYANRKAYEIERNVNGGNKELAAKILSEKKFSDDTNAKAALTAGRLPDAQIEQRSERFATKMFLCHWLAEGHFRWFGEPMPEPWIVSDEAQKQGLGIHHYVECPPEMQPLSKAPLIGRKPAA